MGKGVDRCSDGRNVFVAKVKTDSDGLKKNKNPVEPTNGKEAGTEGVTQSPRGGQKLGLERGAAPAGLLGLGVDDFEAGMGELILVIERAGFEQGGAFRGDKKAGSMNLQLFIRRL